MTDVVAVRAALLSHALSTGLFSDVSGHEPKSAPLGRLHAALWLGEIRPAARQSGLNSTTSRLVFQIRIAQNMMSEPADDVDLDILVATMTLMTAYSGDFDLGGTAAYIDLLGAHGDPMFAKAGYLDQDKRLYRIMVLTIPIILNDVFSQAP